MENPPLSNEDITQLLVETSAKPVQVQQSPVTTHNAIVSGKSNCNEAETIESIEGFMQHILGRGNYFFEKVGKRTLDINILFKRLFN